MNGIIWKKILNHSFSVLGVNIKDHPIMFSEIPINPRDLREKTVKFFFEKFGIPAFYLSKAPVLTTFSHGKSSGLVIESGSSGTSIIPITEGYALINSMTMNKYGGDWLNEQILNRIEQKDELKTRYLFTKKKVDGKFDIEYLDSSKLTKSFQQHHKMRVVEDIKKSIYQISEINFDEKIEVSPIQYELPDGRVLDIGAERYTIPEEFFKYNSNISIQKLLHDCLQKCDTEVKKDIFSNTILSGSNTLIKGFNKRIEKEISGYIKIKSPLTVPLPPYSPHTNWIGGSILASLGSFQQMWISKQEFDENGASIVHKKCI